jgi:hypothetical protein
VRVFDGQSEVLLQDFMAGPNVETLFHDDSNPFRGGVRVAAVDRIGSGRADIVVGFGPPGDPTVNTFDGVTLQQIDSFFAFDPAFKGGVFVGGH